MVRRDPRRQVGPESRHCPRLRWGPPATRLERPSDLFRSRYPQGQVGLTDLEGRQSQDPSRQSDPCARGDQSRRK